MKHTGILLLALLLALSLTACGGGEKSMNHDRDGVNNSANDGTNGVLSGNDADSHTNNSDNKDGVLSGNDNNGALSGSNDNANNGALSGNNNANNGTLPDSNNAGNGTLPGSNNATDGTVSGNGGNTTDGLVSGDIDGDGRSLMDPTPQRHTGWKPASFEQMVRNGRVHDRDGVLGDFENSATPGSTHF